MKKKIYKSPELFEMDSKRKVIGDCAKPGATNSSGYDCTTTGPSATFYCRSTGNSATGPGYCESVGGSA